jgi:hypothetical protein
VAARKYRAWLSEAVIQLPLIALKMSTALLLEPILTAQSMSIWHQWYKARPFQRGEK